MLIFEMSDRKENLSQSLRRTVAGLTAFTEAAVFEHPQKLRGNRKSILPIALAGLLAVLFPAADAAAQQACTQTTVISTASAEPVASSANGECITLPYARRIENRIHATHSNVKISIDGKIEHDSYSFQTVDVRGDNAEVKVGNSGSVVANKSKNGIEISGQNGRVIISGKVISTAPSGLGAGTAINFGNGGYIEVRESGLVSSDGQGGPGINLSHGGTVVVAGQVEQKECTTTPCPSSRIAINGGTNPGNANIILLPRSRINGEIRLQEDNSSKDNIIRIGPGYYSGSSRISGTGWVRIDGGIQYTSQGGGGKKEFHLNSDSGVRISGDLEGAGLLRIEKGDLIFAGHINLGTSGIVDVYRAGRLTFEIGVNAAGDANTYGQLTAGTLNLVEIRTSADVSYSQRIYTGFKEGLTSAQISAIKDRLPTGRDPTNVVPTILTVGQIAFVEEPMKGVRNPPNNFKATQGGTSTLKQGQLKIYSGNSVTPVGGIKLEIDGSNIIGKANFLKNRLGLIKTLRTSTVTGGTGTTSTVTGSTGTGTRGDETGDGDTGDDETGDGDTGDDETGDGDTGDGNTGDGDTGDGDTGADETGDGDTGDETVRLALPAAVAAAAHSAWVCWRC